MVGGIADGELEALPFSIAGAYHAVSEHTLTTGSERVRDFLLYRDGDADGMTVVHQPDGRAASYPGPGVFLRKTLRQQGETGTDPQTHAPGPPQQNPARAVPFG